MSHSYLKNYILNFIILLIILSLVTCNKISSDNKQSSGRSALGKSAKQTTLEIVGESYLIKVQE
ncbi:MAG: hypothetical protein O4859_22985 [Trichodesmium sp. St18_bin1]|nr:hypothetical protein [Trichodesmium sp. St18_bin1]